MIVRLGVLFFGKLVRYAARSPPFFKEGMLDEATAESSRGGFSRTGQPRICPADQGSISTFHVITPLGVIAL